MTKIYTLPVCITMLTIICLGTNLNAQNKALKQVQLSVQMSDKDSCAIDTMRLYSWTGIQVEEIAKVNAVKGKNGYEFNFNLKNISFGNYYLGRIVNNTMSDMRPVVLGVEDKIVMKGSCAAMQQLSFVDSKINSSFEAMVDSIKIQGNEFVALITEYQQNAGNKEKQANIKKAIFELDFRRKELLNRLKKEQPELSKIVALYTYQSFHNNQKSPEQTEGDYIGENYFQFANLADSSYLRVAFFYEAFKSYATNLVQIGLTPEQVQVYLDKTLAKVGRQNPHYKPALLASAFGVMANNKKLFLNYAEQYQKMYRGQNQILDNFLDQQIAQLKSSTEIGDEAPDFSAATPEGGTKSLKSLRGKVILVDFWASWCGPCRRENPNVVAVYNKYKSKGFDVLGVSLDTDAARWKGAIQEDKLTWHHVSDLGGWRSAPAQLYKVTGIPQTLLLDKNGVIIAKNLRGPALEEKLKEIFGDSNFKNNEIKNIEVLKSDEKALNEELNIIQKDLSSEKAVSKNVQSGIKAEIKSSVINNKEIPNLHIEYFYEVARLTSENKTDDYLGGAYSLETSNAAMLTANFIKQSLEGKLSKYIQKGRKVSIIITGSTDASPIVGKINYNGEYGDLPKQIYYNNGKANLLSIKKGDKISDNKELAFLRAQGLKMFIEGKIPLLSETINSFEVRTQINSQTGSQFRKISVEIIIHDAFGEKTTEEKNLQIMYLEKKEPIFMIFTENQIGTSQGSGFFINENGVAVTNFHNFILENKLAKSAYLKTASGNIYFIEEVLEFNEKTDYIVFRVKLGKGEKTQKVDLTYLNTNVGEKVFTIGNPEGMQEIFSTGDVSGQIKENGIDYILSTAPITHGNSGGPLFNLKGEVIGITSMGNHEGNRYFSIDIRQLKLEKYK